MIFDFGKLRLARRSRHYKQKDVGRILHVTPAAVCNWENGNVRVPADILGILAELYDVPVNEFYSQKLCGRKNKKILVKKDECNTRNEN